MSPTASDRAAKGGRYHHGDLRAALVDAAIEQIAERGVRGFSLAEASRRVGVSAAELKKRRKGWKQPKPRYTRGVLAKYAAHVTSASEGAVTDAELKL